ncbi:hypothetical protein ABZZ74_27100 [Streptomyces sp. NPDC006476]|uniref:hypothetical protein n=1 Tax=Streptomyces sp. NPDC006476 TaxID=3157175 RepID=UPI0033A8C62A
MGISSRRARTSAATALLLCFMTAGTAAAEEVPAGGTASETAASTAISADQTTDINDRQGWVDVDEQPTGEKAPTMCDRASCNTIEIGHGSATLPTSETGWNYWETSS